jgi:hypothetical protein
MATQRWMAQRANARALNDLVEVTFTISEGAGKAPVTTIVLMTPDVAKGLGGQLSPVADTAKRWGSST